MSLDSLTSSLLPLLLSSSVVSHWSLYILEIERSLEIPLVSEEPSPLLDWLEMPGDRVENSDEISDAPVISVSKPPDPSSVNSLMDLVAS